MCVFVVCIYDELQDEEKQLSCWWAYLELVFPLSLAHRRSEREEGRERPTSRSRMCTVGPKWAVWTYVVVVSIDFNR